MLAGSTIVGGAIGYALGYDHFLAHKTQYVASSSMTENQVINVHLFASTLFGSILAFVPTAALIAVKTSTEYVWNYLPPALQVASDILSPPCQSCPVTFS